MNLVEKMTSEKIKDNTYMIWLESGSGFGPCSLYAGTWFWSNEFANIKKFVKEIVIIYGLQSIVDIDEEDYKLSFKDLFDKYQNSIDIDGNLKKSFINSVNKILLCDEKTIVELNKSLYKLVNELVKIGAEINAYIFDSPYSARALVESHMEQQLDDFNKKFEEYFSEDIL